MYHAVMGLRAALKSVWVQFDVFLVLSGIAHLVFSATSPRGATAGKVAGNFNMLKVLDTLLVETLKVRTPKVGMLKLGTPKVSMTEVGTLTVSTPKVGMLTVGMLKVDTQKLDPP